MPELVVLAQNYYEDDKRVCSLEWQPVFDGDRWQPLGDVEYNLDGSTCSSKQPDIASEL
jgi:hypothetical protein